MEPSCASWVEARIRELPRYCRALWNLLLDRNLPERYQEDVFATLAFVVDAGAGAPPDVEELAATLCCLAVLFDRLGAILAMHEEILLREGVPVRARLAEAPAQLGRFHAEAAARHEERIAAWTPWLKSANARNRLLHFLRAYLDAAAPPPWPPERLAKLAAAL